MRCSGNTGQCFALWKKLGDERWKVSRGGTAIWFYEVFWKDNACKPGFLCMALVYAVSRVWNISSDPS